MTCWLNWGRVQPQLEALQLAVATVKLSPQLEQLEQLGQLGQLGQLAWLVPWVLRGWRVWPPPVAWLRGPGRP